MSRYRSSPTPGISKSETIRPLGIPGPPLLSTTVQTNTAGQQNQITPSASPAPPPTQKVPPPSFPNYTSAFGSPAQQPVVISSSSQAPASQQNGTTVNDDDEWAFTSALPPGSEQAPARNELVILNSNLHILLEANRPVTMPDGPILIKAKFSNNNSQPIQDLTFQMAVTKVYFYSGEKEAISIMLTSIFSDIGPQNATPEWSLSPGSSKGRSIADNTCRGSCQRCGRGC